MKIKRFTAPTIRLALDQIREEEGPDAVILTNKKLAQGVEIVAAIDYDEVLHQQMKGVADSKPRNTALQKPPVTTEPSFSDGSEYNSLRQEFGSLRSLVQAQLSQLSWTNLSAERPEHAALIRSLTGIGLTGEIVAELAKDIEAINDPENAWREAIALFARKIPLAQIDHIQKGGRYAFIGTTGVGKTTTISKLAARHALGYGSQDIGLISYEPQAMAAPEQLTRTGNILGVAVQKAHNPADLRDTLSQLDSKKLVLIDTPGRSLQNNGFDSTLAGLVDPRNRIRTMLTLSSSSHDGLQYETIEHFKHLELEGVSITKLDEATNLGHLLSVLIGEKLKIAYITEGQELDDGLRSAHASRAAIASKAVSLARQYGKPTDQTTEAASPQPVRQRARA